MNICWLYLDKKGATISAIKDYDNMQYILDHTEENIREKRQAMESLGAVNMDGMPKAHNVRAGEDKIIDAVDEIDAMKERYRQAQEYMAWFKPAWEHLTEDERYVLNMFYKAGETISAGAADEIASRYCIDHSSAHRKKHRILTRFATLLFGK